MDFNGAQGKLDARVISPSGSETNAVVQEVQHGTISLNLSLSIITYFRLQPNIHIYVYTIHNHANVA